jgi:hypothetical protein
MLTLAAQNPARFETQLPVMHGLAVCRMRKTVRKIERQRARKGNRGNEAKGEKKKDANEACTLGGAFRRHSRSPR